MKRVLSIFVLSLWLGAGVCEAVIADTIPTPQIDMAEAVRQATVAAEPYIRGSKRFQPLHAEYLREDGKPFSVNKGKNGWLVIFVPTPMAERKIYVVIPPDGREPEVLVMYH